MLNNIFFIFIFYFIGSIPFALIVPKIFGFGDIRKIGSGNIGATNVLRTGSKYLAVLVLLLDILKGFLPFLILDLFSNKIFILEIFLCHFAILGHIFPVWLKFKGGKGVATYVGLLLGFNFHVALLFGLIWIILAFLKKYASLSSIAAVFSIPLCIYLLNYNNKTIIFFIYLSIILIIKHIENIKRLLKKQENKINFSN